MKTIGKIFLVLVLLAGVIEGVKPAGTDHQEVQGERVMILEESKTRPHSVGFDFGADPMRYPCAMCDGTGRVECRVCWGTGENELYDHLSLVMKGFSKSYCEGCDGRGWNTCGCCHGTGLD